MHNNVLIMILVQVVSANIINYPTSTMQHMFEFYGHSMVKMFISIYTFTPIVTMMHMGLVRYL